MDAETCETCRFRNPDERPGFIGSGQCRRYPPSVAEHVAFDGLGSHHYSQLWPWMSKDAWCGEYRRTNDDGR